MNKQRLLTEIFSLTNSARNFRIWMEARANQYADSFSKIGGTRADLINRFMDVGLTKFPDWISRVTKIYSQELTDAEVKLLHEELLLQREKYGFEQDIPDEAFSKESAAVLKKILSLQPKLDEAMHKLLPLIIQTTTSLIHQRHN